ncbi:four-carbon acid sugar kinase family protein [Salipiger bermudensis]|uniref:3-oxo-tetronate kinase n=1 Tax=Salipiger bermudensis TaxID=344736 RepID=UPI001C994059|nr:3-oxo-tetronate kinase [Salipiger bermudensis]MBY6006147.1 four-carbon acid sugar kinase family protein [Salipiger bermudensis]
MKLGCIGDDFTGSSDLASMLAKNGMRVIQFSGVPDGDAPADVDAGVVALKTRTMPVEEAVRRSLEALDWLLAQGCTQIFFKYCSTFDSTPDGNIGPVTEALMDRLGAETAIVCPAFPATGRTVYQGHLFVHDKLLSESGMEHHPLTPMTDPDIRRWLARQSTRAVGHVPAATVADGPSAIATALCSETGAGRPLVVIDATSDADLRAIGAAAKGQPLITGGSGVAMGLPANLLGAEALHSVEEDWRGEAGPAALIAGSASTMTRAQIARWRERNPAREITADEVMQGRVTPDEAARAALDSDSPLLLYSSADPERVKAAQETYGREIVAGRLEAFFAETARLLVAGGVRRLVTAGGETSGAVVEGLGLTALRIGPEITPGVPAVAAEGQPLVLALKSGNFGDVDFFETALAMLEART